MVASIKKKEKIIYELQKIFKDSLSVVVASVRGVTSNAVNELRKKSRDCGVYMRVVPNSLLRRAVLDTSYGCLSDFFVGESIVAFSTQKPGDAARIFMQFSENNENFTIKCAAYEGSLIRSDKIYLLSNLPNHNESILRFILVLKMISVGNLITVLKALFNYRDCNLQQD